MAILKGKKTIIGCVLLGIATTLNALGIIPDDQFQTLALLLASFTGIAMRAALKG